MMIRTSVTPYEDILPPGVIYHSELGLDGCAQEFGFHGHPHSVRDEINSILWRFVFRYWIGISIIRIILILVVILVQFFVGYLLFLLGLVFVFVALSMFAKWEALKESEALGAIQLHLSMTVNPRLEGRTSWSLIQTRYRDDAFLACGRIRQRFHLVLMNGPPQIVEHYGGFGERVQGPPVFAPPGGVPVASYSVPPGFVPHSSMERPVIGYPPGNGGPPPPVAQVFAYPGATFAVRPTSGINNSGGAGGGVAGGEKCAV